MIITHKVEIDLMRPGIQQWIHTVQDDKYSRNLEITLIAGGAAWEFPSDTTVVIRYVKADGTGGEYDTLPDGTAIIAEEQKAPAFDQNKDYRGWPVGAPVTDEGQVWTLIQPHNAADYIGRPSSLRALWGLAHTKDPAKAKPWVAPYGISGLYMIDEVCAQSGHIWRNRYDNNEFPPETVGVEDSWEDLAGV